MKKKYRILELANGRFEIQAKILGFWGLFDNWSFWDEFFNLKDAITYCEERIIQDKSKYGPKKVVKIIKP